ncbi:MAG: hypothetical protein COY40_00560 [Alphaproteobacteria bacterium CG_4_10_14_0_8_um_filter_53_9]|nr:MAG: hypothetical protein COY40_00560 [Alphaproteobacteria bacterium CG_4_10_14_0_8_um_filter_53_9]
MSTALAIILFGVIPSFIFGNPAFFVGVVALIAILTSAEMIFEALFMPYTIDGHPKATIFNPKGKDGPTPLTT